MKNNKNRNSDKLKYFLENTISLDDYKDDDLKLLLALSLISNQETNERLESIKKNVQFFFYVTLFSIIITLFVFFTAENI